MNDVWPYGLLSEVFDMAGSEPKHKLNGKFGLEAIADDNKTSVGSIRRRLKLGMTLEEAVADILKNQQLSKERRNKKRNRNQSEL
ncbi:hypothetical protein VPGG_00053 [Vibrio phage VBM1]|uniref:hypothetical protein n=1 Tax=Vibrio phage VBM1 TaxID=754074 RepID=UPI0002C13C09|nr:hypothetical protein VPGG_00053 [Vibrio phage VBM1]AGH07370.1 hypothetical protein VPGG_00053 [Vibrio phage VBM1]